MTDVVVGAVEQSSPESPSGLTHVDAQGQAQMVDVTDKSASFRQARACATVLMQPETLQKIWTDEHSKGDVLAVARVAGIQAAKKCSDLIPLCHPLPLTSVKVNFLSEQSDGENGEIAPKNAPATLTVEAIVKVSGVTGVEMEALTAVSVAALTVYDMCKAVDPHMVIAETYVAAKRGGKSNWGSV